MRTLKKSDLDSGFTLVEVMVAIVVLGLAVVGIVSMNTASVGGNAAASITTEAVNIVTRHIEALMTVDNNHAWVQDTNANGTAQDTDNDGRDDVDDDADTVLEPGEDNFGLDDTPLGLDGLDPAVPDNTIATDDNEYDIYWNVARDVPVPNIDTIRVIVAPRKGIFNRRTVTVDFMRPRLF